MNDNEQSNKLDTAIPRNSESTRHSEDTELPSAAGLLPPATFIPPECSGACATGDTSFTQIVGDVTSNLRTTHIPDTVTVPINKAPWYVGEAQSNDKAVERPREGESAPEYAPPKGVHLVAEPPQNVHRVRQEKLVHHPVVRYRRFSNFVRHGIVTGLSRLVGIIRRMLD